MVFLNINVKSYDLVSGPDGLQLISKYNVSHWIAKSFLYLIIFLSLLRILLKYRSVKLVYQKIHLYFLAGIVMCIIINIIVISTGGIFPIFVQKGGLFAFQIYYCRGDDCIFSYQLQVFKSQEKGFYLQPGDSDWASVSVPLSILLYVLNIWLSGQGFFRYILIIVPVLLILLWIFNLSIILVKKVVGIPYREKR